MASIWTSAEQAQQQGFDKLTYLTAKAAQLGPTWTPTMVEAAFASAGLEAYQHYQEFGWKEGLSPNQYFSSSYYNTSKATAAGVTDAAFQTAWNNANGGTQTSTYFHYLQFGAYENSVNPASVFDDYQYYVDKAALLGNGTTWEQVRTIFQQNGLTPITHYMLYGGTPNEPTPQPVGGGTGTTYTLTTGIDNIPGTALNDTIVAGEVGGLQTLTAGDEINGAGGTNTINVSANAAHNYGGFTMQNVQTLNVTADGGAQTFDLSGTTGLQNIVSLNSSQAVIANNVASLAGVAVTNATATANMTVAYQDSLLTSGADTVALSLNNSSAGIVTLGDVTTGNTGIETVALHSTGTATTLNTLNSQITNLTFDGSANVTITNAVADTVKVIDASTATGGLTVGIAATNANAVTFTGGSGADSITFGAGSLTAADTVTGGTGNDTLIADRAGLFAAGAAGKVAGVETITMSDQLTAASTFKGSTWFADATTFNLNAGYAAGATATITTGTGGTAGQAVRIAGVNAGTLTITDSATSATNDQATLGVYNGATANVAYTTNELETVNLTSGSTTATTASGTLNALTVSGGLNKTTTLNISGADNLTLTTAASAINTVAAGSALGNLNLLGVTYAVPAATTATGATITTGSGADQVSGTIGIDTVNTGAGNDIVTGTQGADAITLGAGTDQVVYTALNQSNAASTDTIADFVSGTDILDISGLGATAVATGGLNQTTFALAQGALTGGGTVSAVFQQDANTLWVDMDGNGTLDANDFRVVLSGATSLTAADIGLANVIIVAGGVANTGTAGNDIFQASDATLQTAGTTIDGLAGINTLDVQDALTAALNLQTGVNTKATNIDVINLQAGTGGFALTVQNENDVTVNASAASTVVLGAATGQSFNGSAAADTLTLGATNQSAAMAAGADFINSTQAFLADANLDFGSGSDTLTVTTAGAVNLLGGAGNTTVSGLEIVTLTGASTLDANINGLTVNVGAGNTTVTNAGASQTVVATGLNGFDLVLAGTGATAVTDLEDTGSDVTINLGAGATSVQIDVGSAATAHTITNNSTNTTTVDAINGIVAGAQTVTLAGTGNFSVTDAGGVGGMDITVTGSGNVGLSSLDGALALIANGTGSVSVDAADLAGATALTITGSQNVTVTNLLAGNVAAGGGTGAYNITVTNAATAGQTIVTDGAVDTITFSALGAASTGGTTVSAGAGADNITIGTNAAAVTVSDVAGNVSTFAAGVDIVTGFRAAAGADVLKVGGAYDNTLLGTTNANAVTSATVAAELATSVNATAGLTADDAVLVHFTNYDGAAADFLWQDTDSSGTYTNGDTVIRLVGTVGALTAADIII